MADESIIADLKSQGFDKLIQDLSLSAKGFTELDKSMAEAQKKLDTLDKSSQEFKDLTKEINAAAIASKAYAESSDSLKRELSDTNTEIGKLQRSLNALEKAGETNTQTYKDLVASQDALKKKSGELTNTIKDLNQEIKNSGSDTRNLDKAVRAISTVASGYQVAQGALALYGGENKKFEQTLLKLNAVMAITQGLQQIQEELSKRDSVFTQAAAKAKLLYASATRTATGALNGFRVAMISLGIGAFIIAIGALVANWDRLKIAISGVIGDLDRMREAKKKEIEQSNELIKGLELELEYRVAIGEISEKKALEDKLKAQQDNLKLKGQNLEIQKKIQAQVLKDSKTEIQVMNTKFNKLETYHKASQSMVLDQIEKTKKATEAYQRQAITVKQIQDELDALNKPKKVQTDKLKDTKVKISEPIEIPLPAKLSLPDPDKSIQDVFAQLQEQIRVAESELLAEFTINPNSESLEPLSARLRDLTKQLEIVKARYEDIKNPKPINILDGFIEPPTPESLEKDFPPAEKTLYERIFGTPQENETRAQEIQRIANGALKIVSELNNIGNQITDIASQAIEVRSQNEIRALDQRKQQGLISEKQYQKEMAKIKNEAARKQRTADIAMAFAMIPQAALSAFTSTPGGIVVKSIAAALASAFGLAQVALIASAPLPQFRDGGQVSKKLGFIKGARHERGGVPIEVEGEEYVMPVEQTKENLPALEAMRKGKFNELFIPKQNVMQPDVFANIPNPSNIALPIVNENNDYSSINKRLDKLASEMWWLGQYTKEGNKVRERGTEKIVKNLETQRKRYV